MTTITADRIEKRVLLRAPRARVWRALTNAKEFANWFGGFVFSGRFAPGARVSGTLTVPGHESRPFEITIERVEPERLFSFRWQPSAIGPAAEPSSEPMTLVEFTLEGVADGIQLTVAESGFDRIPLLRRVRAIRDNERGWTTQMENLQHYVDQTA